MSDIAELRNDADVRIFVVSHPDGVATANLVVQRLLSSGLTQEQVVALGAELVSRMQADGQSQDSNGGGGAGLRTDRGWRECAGRALVAMVDAKADELESLSKQLDDVAGGDGGPDAAMEFGRLFTAHSTISQQYGILQRVRDEWLADLKSG